MKEQQSIIRVQKNRNNPFVMIDKRIFSDNRLSWKAKGILGYLLSKPDDWTVRVADLVKQSTDGRDSVYSGLKELLANGYMERIVQRDAKGRITAIEYYVYEQPISLEPTTITVAKTASGKSVYGESDTTNNDLTDNEFNKKYNLGIPNQQNHTPNTLVAEATQIYPSNQHDQQVGNSKVPISFAGYCRSYKVDPDVIKVVNYYLEKYKEQLGKEHPRLKPHQWLQVTEEILSPLCDEQLENPRWIEITPSQLLPMIDQHFLTSYKTGGYSILHFCCNNIRLRRYYEVYGEE